MHVPKQSKEQRKKQGLPSAHEERAIIAEQNESKHFSNPTNERKKTLI